MRAMIVLQEHNLQLSLEPENLMEPETLSKQVSLLETLIMRIVEENRVLYSIH